MPAELVSTHPSFAATASSLRAIHGLDATHVRLVTACVHVRLPVQNHVEVYPPDWLPLGFGRALEELHVCNDMSLHVRREHRLAVDVCTIHPTRIVSHVEAGG